MVRPFNDPIGDYSRNAYGNYRSRYSRQKVGIESTATGTWTFGTWEPFSPWVTIDPTIDDALSPTEHDIAMYEVEFQRIGGAWVGTLGYKILIDGVKVYPFGGSENATDGWSVSLGTLSTIVRTGQVCEVLFSSSSALDDGKSASAIVRSAILREV